ncbi:MAG: restriction endonuclease subunit S [Oscillospiraceae bacterium]|nr:restriction endonuclease subunit S [Oscillospiraceae bacterium]
MTPRELKNSILQLAIQGKLVEQRPEEGTAKALLQSIEVCDSVDGQSVKQKTITEISENDISFDIPDSWEWVKLGTVCTIARGGSPRPIKDYITTAEDGINWIKIGDTEKNGKYIRATAEKIKPSGASKSRLVHSGDFLLTNSMSFGRPYILKTDGCIHDGWLVISQSSEIFDQDYLYWVLSSGYAYTQFCGKVSGAVVKNLNSDKVANSVFPLPPLAEQKRIVAKIEELLPLIDRYEQAWNRLEDLNKRFPTDLQKSILQLAIQGKLVPQRPEEGTGEELYQQIQAEKQALIKAGKLKKEKPLPEITEGEIPFDIPEHWKWVRWGDLAESIQYGYNAPALDAGRIKMVRISDIQNGRVLWEKVPYCDISEKDIPTYLLKSNDILFARTGGTVGKSYHVKDVPEDAIYAGYLIRTRYSKLLCSEYMKYFMDSQLYWDQLRNGTIATAQPNCNGKTLSKMIIPIPPLVEQKRIVLRIREIQAISEKLK